MTDEKEKNAYGDREARLRLYVGNKGGITKGDLNKLNDFDISHTKTTKI